MFVIGHQPYRLLGFTGDEEDRQKFNMVLRLRSLNKIKIAEFKEENDDQTISNLHKYTKEKLINEFHVVNLLSMEKGDDLLLHYHFVVISIMAF